MDVQNVRRWVRTIRILPGQWWKRYSVRVVAHELFVLLPSTPHTACFATRFIRIQPRECFCISLLDGGWLSSCCAACTNTYQYCKLFVCFERRTQLFSQSAVEPPLQSRRRPRMPRFCVRGTVAGFPNNDTSVHCSWRIRPRTRGQNHWDFDHWGIVRCLIVKRSTIHQFGYQNCRLGKGQIRSQTAVLSYTEEVSDIIISLMLQHWLSERRCRHQ